MMGRERILLVDDHEANLVALEAILNPLRKTLVRARSGAEAMKALLRDDFALVLLDVVMPGMDGFETASHIKRLDQTKDVAIIFLTGADGDPSHTFRGYVAGAVDFLTKPFDPWVLRAKVQVFLDLHRKNRQLREQANLLQRMAGRSEDDVRGGGAGRRSGAAARGDGGAPVRAGAGGGRPGRRGGQGTVGPGGDGTPDLRQARRALQDRGVRRARLRFPHGDDDGAGMRRGRPVLE
ncbi:two-component system response regulator [Planobispora siamensis]|uniref:response regulator n=1 Tax=Planobispora siamensis TaxID=936338 RepID=UPI0035F0911D